MYRPVDRGSIPIRGNFFLLTTTTSRPALGNTQPFIQKLLGVVSLGIKQLEREADHKPVL
jgi:hypothetical protein